MVRLVAGPACDRFGPRWVFAGTLLLGAIPLGLAPLVHNAQGLYVSRFFIGILGGSFVPCQVWSTGFFDKNVVGSANALTGGWGNAGGGITYFIMPAVFDSLVARGYSDGVAWRLSFIVPLVITIATGISMLLLCPDTPTGKWSERHEHANQNLASHTTAAGIVSSVPGNIVGTANSSSAAVAEADEKKPAGQEQHWDREATLSSQSQSQTETETPRADIAAGEVIAKPTWTTILRVLASPQTAFLVLTYACSFGGELAINAVLGAYYAQSFPSLGQTAAANWAAMFGFLNLVTRPLGGVVADAVYRRRRGGGVWAKKLWIVLCGCATGALLVVIGTRNPHHHHLPTTVGLVALAAVFLEAGNGANFALVPHVHPAANGVLSGITGAGGNLGGVVFAVVFRFVGSGRGGGGSDYATGFWVIGVVTVVLNLGLAWVAPVPRGRGGGF